MPGNASRHVFKIGLRSAIPTDSSESDGSPDPSQIARGTHSLVWTRAAEIIRSMSPPPNDPFGICPLQACKSEPFQIFNSLPK